ncbi:rhophilin-1 isoform X2 [Ictidomys tridecemlineatus]|uniref:Rhophilin Rho GTPase binding protein 1 n=1 Tax=Ictidomys tridecemlineatus TaxID=43179 RepID=I3N3W2_ICTTR|nr:rhophilin-1 isoform X1 [Ictidomys tridecemlineatus]KAG3273477.1 rhophilin Rho GTPase binding protein 1 [Ictidomys tridecemlineatus]
MILEERPDGQGAGEDSAQLQAAGGVRKVSDPTAQTRHSWLQSPRARIRQQISKELRMRTGAENLYRATSNDRVRETVALELSYVNSNLQLLKEELEGLSSGPDTHRPEGEGVTVPMIPLGLKETTELDWATPLKELISGHFGEDGASYEAEIRELEDLRQAMRTPSRDDAGLRLLAAYYSQLCFLEGRFFSPARSLGLVFHWYDSLTGVPAQQRALAFEKGSVLFNIGALHTQIGARQDRSCAAGARRAAQAFQLAAGAFGLLRENFSQAPSPDMSTTCLCALERLMAAQAQECVFEGLSLPALALPHDCLAQLHLAQEAAQVAAEYRLVHQAMAQPPVQDYVPASWTTLVHVKAEHFHALAHYHAATALCDGSLAAEGELPACEQVFQPPTPGEPHSPALPQQPEERRKLAKAHLKRAILGQEEALRLHASCRVLRKVDLLQAVVAQALRHSLAKYSKLEREDDFFEAAEAPDIQPKTHQKSEVRVPSLSFMKVADIFHRLGPLPVFSAKNRWQLVGPIHLTRGEGGFGFTLRGDSPVLIAAVVPGGQAAAAGLQQGDYIVSVNGQPCKWWRHADVVTQLREAGAAGVSLQVASMLPRQEPRSTGDHQPALLGPGRLPRSRRACGFEMPAPTRASPQPLLVWSRRAKQGKPRGRPPPCTGGDCGTCP